MKKIISLVIALSMASAAFSETKWGFDAGYDHNWLTAKTTLNTISLDGTEIINIKSSKAVVSLDGFHVTGTFSYYIDNIEGLFFTGGIGYQYAIGKVPVADVPTIIFDVNQKMEEIEKCQKITYKMHNLQIPLRIGYEYVFDNDLGIFIYAGPLINIALDWQLIGEYTDETGVTTVATLHQISGNYTSKTGNKTSKDSNDDYKHYNVFDVALGGAVGVSYKWVYASVGCDAGLLNICKHPSFALNTDKFRFDVDNRAHNVQLKVSVGARF